MDTQSQIRQNAEEVSSYLRDMSKWEKNINNKILRKTTISSNSKNLSIRSGSGTVKTSGGSSYKNSENPFRSNDPHMVSELTPATLVEGLGSPLSASVVVPAARGIANLRDAEAAERERGNKEFHDGNFAAAIKSYTKCLGLKVNKIDNCKFFP